MSQIFNRTTGTRISLLDINNILFCNSLLFPSILIKLVIYDLSAGLFIICDKHWNRPAGSSRNLLEVINIFFVIRNNFVRF
jgi:hypothetical protein